MKVIKIYIDDKLYAKFDADKWPEEWSHVDYVAMDFTVASKEQTSQVTHETRSKEASQ